MIISPITAGTRKSWRTTIVSSISKGSSSMTCSGRSPRHGSQRVWKSRWTCALYVCDCHRLNAGSITNRSRRAPHRMRIKSELADVPTRNYRTMCVSVPALIPALQLVNSRVLQENICLCHVADPCIYTNGHTGFCRLGRARSHLNEAAARMSDATNSVAAAVFSGSESFSEPASSLEVVLRRASRAVRSSRRCKYSASMAKHTGSRWSARDV